MENAVEALKIAFGIMMFVLALTLSISCFSQANSAITAIIALRDREAQYTYVTPTPGGTRTVGVDTVIPTMYKAYKENFAIYFYDTDGTTPLPLYYKINQAGEKEKDESGNFITINYIDLESKDENYRK